MPRQEKNCRQRFTGRSLGCRHRLPLGGRLLGQGFGHHRQGRHDRTEKTGMIGGLSSLASSVPAASSEATTLNVAS